MDEPPSNSKLAAGLDDFAALLELAGEQQYSARAFRRAAELIRGTPLPVGVLVRNNRARELRGIGPGIERRLRELVETGHIEEVRELRRTVSPELAALGRLLGFGAKRGAAIGATLGITTAEELRAAAESGRLQEVPGIGPGTEAKIRAALSREQPGAAQVVLLNRARELSGRIASALGGVAAGETRRWCDEVHRIVIVVTSERPAEVLASFTALPDIVALLEPTTGVSADGIPVDLVIAAPASFGTELLRATGPAGFVDAFEPLPVSADEESVFVRLGIPFVPPELRTGPHSRPVDDLVRLEHIKGDLHTHSTWSDGKASILEMGRAARDLGYEYLAICDHTPNVTVVPGLDGEAVRRQADEIAAVNQELAPFRVLRGIECDIRRDGSLDLADDVLNELEWVQLSLHAGQRASRVELTARVVHAMHHPAVRCLSHPTGRLIGHRPENALDLEATIEAALATGVALEVNGLPARLDLKSEHVRAAVGAGVRIVCSTDAHSTHGLANIELSVHTARAGHATRSDVLNTRSLAELLPGP